jgi:hypothetical protein
MFPLKTLIVPLLSPSIHSLEVRRSVARRLSLVRFPSILWLDLVLERRLGETWSVETGLLLWQALRCVYAGVRNTLVWFGLVWFMIATFIVRTVTNT